MNQLLCQLYSDGCYEDHPQMLVVRDAKSTLEGALVLMDKVQSLVDGDLPLLNEVSFSVDLEDVFPITRSIGEALVEEVEERDHVVEEILSASYEPVNDDLVGCLSLVTDGELLRWDFLHFDPSGSGESNRYSNNWLNRKDIAGLLKLDAGYKRVHCPRCKGEGDLDNGDNCPRCGGDGIVILSPDELKEVGE